MPVAAPQHLRARPSRPALRHSLALRRGTLLTAGAAVALPSSLGTLGPPAVAAPSAPTTVPGAAAATPTLPAAPTSVVVLRYGSTGSHVRVLQERLDLTVDGSFGPRTLAAVKSFQADKGLAVDGIVGPKTWAALGGYLGPQPTDDTPTAPATCATHVLRYGSSGSTVKVLQQRLDISVDGNFGPATLRSVRAYQSTKGLLVDGIVGPRTWAALGGFPCGTTSETPSTPEPNDPPTDTPSSATGQRVLEIAKQYIGIDYVYGAESPEDGFDCSGLTQYVYRQVGIELPRTSRDQSQFRPGIADLNDLRVGDLVFFHSPIRHVAIYAGNGQILDASQPGTKISIHKMWVSPQKAIRLV